MDECLLEDRSMLIDNYQQRKEMSSCFRQVYLNHQEREERRENFEREHFR